MGRLIFGGAGASMSAVVAHDFGVSFHHGEGTSSSILSALLLAQALLSKL
ncbi:MAG: hypothetical protein AAF730_00035 [Bacteroidota bacterium]